MHPSLLNFLFENRRPRVELEHLNVAQRFCCVAHAFIFPLHQFCIYFFQFKTNKQICEECEHKYANSSPKTQTESVEQEGKGVNQNNWDLSDIA